jgi:glycine/D-amino acid oxidase-like deaminating enzyme/nitrite reductase/ring-hydroxylating ferredoxin subunit
VIKVGNNKRVQLQFNPGSALAQAQPQDSGMIPERHTTPWLEALETTPPRLETATEYDVAIIGAGITGLTAAYNLAKHGLKVVVLERKTFGHGETGFSTAHLTARPDIEAAELIQKFGEAKARQVWESGAEAIVYIEEICKLEGIDAHFQRLDGWLIARDEDGVQTINDESEALKLLGIEHEIASSPIHAKRALKIPNQARFNVGLYLNGLAKAATSHGAILLEGTAVVSMTSGEPHELELETTNAANRNITAKSVIVATHVPIWTHYLVLDKLKAAQSYVIGAKISKGAAPDVIMDDTAEPYHYFRLEPQNDHDLVIFGGEDHGTGGDEATPERFANLERELMAWLPDVELEVVYRWSGEVWETLDGLPYIGADLPPAPKRFIATGYDGVGTTFGTVAGLMAVAWVLGETHQYADLYAPGRIGARDIPSMIGSGLGYAKQLVSDRLEGLLNSNKLLASDLEPGGGAIIEIPKLGQVAAYKTEAGDLITVSAVCSHAGCEVSWNAADHTWDCGCHGSRFAPDGEVIAGPAVYALKPVQ